jgi:hypothetical protein
MKSVGAALTTSNHAIYNIVGGGGQKRKPHNDMQNNDDSIINIMEITHLLTAQRMAGIVDIYGIVHLET